jgi:cytochrome c oxidase subunit 2
VRHRASFLQLALFAVGSAVIMIIVAYAIPWLPYPASREAGRINFIFWFAEWISILIFAVVAAPLVYSLYAFRAKEDDWSDGPPTHGHTGLEIAWTAIPFLIVTAIAVASAVVLAKNGRAGTDPLRITVTGQQFAWTFTYPNGQTYPVLRLPQYRHVKLTLTSKDVLHSFWVPQLYQKQDVVPGLPTHLVVTPTRTGVYPVICVELCGLGHSTMRSEAIVMTESDYDAWYHNAGAAAAAPGGGGGANAGLAVFNSNGCGACHTFTAAKAAGKVGPDLDKLKQEAAGAGQQLEAFIKESITDPDKYIAPGYQPHVMPATFGQSIPASKLDQLVQYLATNTK